MKNYLVELIGTFFLVLVIGMTGNPIAIGVMLMVMVYMGGHISGAHYNPAVTIGVLIRGKIEMKDAVLYIISQLIGASLAAFAVLWITGYTIEVAPASWATSLKVLVVEAAFTFALVSVVLNVATHPKTAGNSFYGLAIGFTVMAGAFAGGHVSGGAYNPAVGTGPILIDAILGDGSTTNNLWYYWVGPLLGGILAAVTYKITAGEDAGV